MVRKINLIALSGKYGANCTLETTCRVKERAFLLEPHKNFPGEKNEFSNKE